MAPACSAAVAQNGSELCTYSMGPEGLCLAEACTPKEHSPLVVLLRSRSLFSLAGETPLTTQAAIVALVGASVLAVVVVNCRLKARKPLEPALAMFRLLSLAVRVTFVWWLGVTRSMLQECNLVIVGVSFEALFGAALTILLLGLVFNAVVSTLLLRQQQDEHFVDWAAKHRLCFLLVRALSVTHSSSALLLSSGSFSLQALSAPLSELAERHFSLAGLASTLLLDLPLFTLNLLASLEVLTNERLRIQISRFMLLFDLTLSGCSLFYALLSKLVPLCCGTGLGACARVCCQLRRCVCAKACPCCKPTALHATQSVTNADPLRAVDAKTTLEMIALGLRLDDQ
jgi:hypothetical protein